MMKTVSFRARLGVHALNIALLSGTMFTAPAVAQEALPTGGQVVAGSATIATNGPNMTINQSSDTMIANWQSFSIGADNSVTFNQPTAQSVALNRVIGQDPSTILGSLTANGQVFLINPNGIVIGKGGSVQSGGFVGSTLDMSNADFLNGQYRFAGSGGSIVNQGDLKGGVVALIAPRVVNDGTITGSTALAAGTDVTLDFDGDGLISVEVNRSSLATLVENNGLIKADGGVAILTAKGANDALKGVVNNTGIIEAQSLAARDGRILLLGDMENGEVNAAGTLAASFVETSAKQVNIAEGLQVKTGGGQWLIDPNDFTVAASGGNMTGTTLSNNLANGSVQITTLSQGTNGGNGDIFINDGVTWSANTLTLTADRNITINSEMNGSGTAGLTLQYSQLTADGDYYINAPVNLASTGNFTTWNGNLVTHYTIITSLGAEGSTTRTDLQGINGNLSGNYVLGADIDASTAASWNGGLGFMAIGRGGDTFSGNLDGLGHVISGLNISGNNYSGFIGRLSGYLAHVTLEDVSISGISGGIYGTTNVGALVGWNESGIIKRSHAQGIVSGVGQGSSWAIAGGLVGTNSGLIIESSADVAVSATSGSGIATAGGLVGSNTNYSNSSGQAFRGLVQRSHSEGTVSASGVGLGVYAGGLVGDNGGDGIRDSYSTSSVNGTARVGGLVGRNGSIISFSYATGSVTGVGSEVGGLVGAHQLGEVIGSFFDSQTTGQSVGCGVGASTCSATGLTTAQMKTSAPYIAAGWDFTNVWAIDPAINNGYPYLRATLAAAPPPPPPPPPPPVVVLAVNDFAASFSTTTAPYQPTINLTGTGFADVTEVRFTWTDPNGQTGTVIWNAALNNFGGGRFVVGASGTTATISPVLVAAGDPSGTYQWTVTFVAGAQTVTKNFAVAYTAVVVPPPPPPPPVVPLSLTSGIGSSYSTGVSPYQPTFNLTGQGFTGVTAITLNWTDPAGRTGTVTWNASNNFGGGRFVPSASGTSATLSPVLVAAGDPPGLYQWTISLTNGGQPISRLLSVSYNAPQLVAPVTSGNVLLGGIVWGLPIGSTIPGLIGTTTAGSTAQFFASPDLINFVESSRINPSLGQGLDLWNGSLSVSEAAQSLLPYAFLAEHVYSGSSSNVPAGWSIATSWRDVLRTGMSAQGMNSVQIEIAILAIGASGFDAQIYQRDGQYVVAFEGTTFWSAADWQTNLQQVFSGTVGNQYDFALMFSNFATAQFGNSITLTGHSLGGGLAQYVASQRTDLRAITFNAAGISGSSTSLQNVINVRVSGDPVSSGIVTNQLGSRTYIYQNPSNTPSLVNHPINNIIYGIANIAM